MGRKEVADDAVVTVRCKLCGHKFELPAKTARTISGKNEGFIPCENCESWSTVWDMTKIK